MPPPDKKKKQNIRLTNDPASTVPSQLTYKKGNWWHKTYETWIRRDSISAPLDKTMMPIPINKVHESTNHDNLEKLLDKLRWVTLGHHHNWDTKRYTDDCVSPFPDNLKELSKTVLSSLGKLTTTE